MAKWLNAPDFDSGTYVGSNPTTPVKSHIEEPIKAAIMQLEALCVIGCGEHEHYSI